MAVSYDSTKDPYSKYVRDQDEIRSAPALKAAAVTPNDSTDLADYAKSLLVASNGNVVLLPAKNDDAATITLTGVTAGQVIPILTRRVLVGTTATVVALYD